MRLRSTLVSLLCICSGAVSTPVWGQPACLQLAADLFGRHEVPALSNVARGQFSAILVQHEDPEVPDYIDWSLGYPQGIGVTQAHIHFGQAGVNGGIVAFLCSNLGNGPAGTQTCPEVIDREHIFAGEIVAENIVGAASQGLAAGDFFALQRAIRQGVTYVNVHSTTFPGGLIRGQVKVVGTCNPSD